MVGHLAQKARDAGSSPAQHYTFRLHKNKNFNVVDKPYSRNRKVSCATGYTHQKFYKIIRVFYFMCMILFTYSLWDSYVINYLMCSILFFNFFGRFKQARDCILTNRDLACSIITISENATPKNLLMVMYPQCNCEKQEYQVFHSITVSDLQHKHDHYAGVSQKRGIFKQILNI